MMVLGTAVDDGLLASWAAWTAPAVQPFFVESLESWPQGVARAEPMALELAHTYRTWRVDRSLETLWLDQDGFQDLSPNRRADLIRF